MRIDPHEIITHRRVSGSALLRTTVLACCAAGATVLHAGCAAHEDDARVVATRNAIEAAATVSEEQVAAVRAARSQVWNQLASDLPDGYLLSAELFHPELDHAFAVVTVVEGHRAVGHVIGPPTAALDLAARGPAAAEAIALGQPPEKEPPPPGIAALGSFLVKTAFPAGLRAAPDGERAAHSAEGRAQARPGRAPQAAVSSDVVDLVRVARWRAWQPQAARLPEGHVLAIELLHSRPDQAFAVFTVVRDRAPVEHVVGAAPDIAGEPPASPNAIPLGEPPPKEPPPPGIVAQGTLLLSLDHFTQ